MTECNFNHLLNDLWTNWAFRLSLSSNELFHSNVLQYLVETRAAPPSTARQSNSVSIEDSTDISAGSGNDSEPTMIDQASAIRLLEVLCGVDRAKCCATSTMLTNPPANLEFSVQREWRHMDLVILGRDTQKKKNKKGKFRENEWLPIFALEVKLKAYPEPAQLNRYREVLDKMWQKQPTYRPPLFLLTGMGEDAIEGLDDTYLVNFESLATGLNKLTNKSDPVAEKYIELCTLLHELFKVLKKKRDGKPTWQTSLDIAKELEPYRLHSLWWKLWAAFVKEKCCEKVEAQLDAPTYLGAYSGYTRTGNLGVCWKWPLEQGKKRDSKPRQEISIGVQIEGYSVRLFLNIVHDSLGAPQKARGAVEAVLLELMKNHGVFAANPGIQIWRDRRDPKEQTGDSNLLDITLPTGEVSVSSSCASVTNLFDKKVGKGQGDRLLTGYANGHGNGFADFRLTLATECAIEDVAHMVCGVLVDDLFSVPQKAANNLPLLLRVVKGFENAVQVVKVEDWIENPTLV